MRNKQKQCVIDLFLSEKKGGFAYQFPFPKRNGKLLLFLVRNGQKWSVLAGGKSSNTF